MFYETLLFHETSRFNIIYNIKLIMIVVYKNGEDEDYLS
jgi:hypothetical protein